ncbi:type I-MYXAN CRISPR-associated protein Cas6/Cmx6 [Gemmata algarum]|uniref:type I-MYXAN CRISPR-associated protein Cas6/Cmx6 n=1 Tax=Gemmata algarum TaxID=2975278 RepID=UPI002A75AE40|nr:type I-MYXAN CRISPR-associated protein Cas6/Cmx6 [Gemmata algarum]
MGDRIRFDRTTTNIDAGCPGRLTPYLEIGPTLFLAAEHLFRDAIRWRAPVVDLVFPVRGGSVPTDHAYPLYGALSGAVPAFHDAQQSLRFAPLTGVRDEAGRLRLAPWSRLRVRLPAEAIPNVLPLAGRALDIAGARVALGAPSVEALVPAPALESWLVTFKHGEEPAAFLAATRARLTELGVAGEPAVRAFESGPRAGEVRRRVVRVSGAAIVGYALLVSGLTAEESIRLQECGLGGRTKIGCGFFLPAREAK